MEWLESALKEAQIAAKVSTSPHSGVSFLVLGAEEVVALVLHFATMFLRRTGVRRTSSHRAPPATGCPRCLAERRGSAAQRGTLPYRCPGPAAGPAGGVGARAGHAAACPRGMVGLGSMMFVFEAIGSKVGWVLGSWNCTLAAAAAWLP